MLRACATCRGDGERTLGEVMRRCAARCWRRGNPWCCACPCSATRTEVAVHAGGDGPMFSSRALRRRGTACGGVRRPPPCARAIDGRPGTREGCASASRRMPEERRFECWGTTSTWTTSARAGAAARPPEGCRRDVWVNGFHHLPKDAACWRQAGRGARLPLQHGATRGTEVRRGGGGADETAAAESAGRGDAHHPAEAQAGSDAELRPCGRGDREAGSTPVRRARRWRGEGPRVLGDKSRAWTDSPPAHQGDDSKRTRSASRSCGVRDKRCMFAGERSPDWRGAGPDGDGGGESRVAWTPQAVDNGGARKQRAVAKAVACRDYMFPRTAVYEHPHAIRRARRRTRRAPGQTAAMFNHRPGD